MMKDYLGFVECPIPGSKILCDFGHETEIGVLRGKPIDTSNALY